MAGIGLEDGKAKQALESVNKHLATQHGIVLQQPAFSKYYIHMGEISSYPPGYKENAGIFCHNNPWIIIAETMVGNGDRAFDYYTRINPSAREKIGDLHRCEPYVFAQMIAGKDAPTHGEAKNSWLTGTAAWTYFTVTQWILGIRTELRRPAGGSLHPQRLGRFYGATKIPKRPLQNHGEKSQTRIQRNQGNHGRRPKTHRQRPAGVCRRQNPQGDGGHGPAAGSAINPCLQPVSSIARHNKKEVVKS